MMVEDGDLEILKLLSSTSSKIAQGEVLQLQHKGEADSTTDQGADQGHGRDGIAPACGQGFGDGVHHPEGEGDQVTGVTGDVEEKLPHGSGVLANLLATLPGPWLFWTCWSCINSAIPRFVSRCGWFCRPRG